MYKALDDWGAAANVCLTFRNPQLGSHDLSLQNRGFTAVINLFQYISSGEFIFLKMLTHDTMLNFPKEFCQTV